MPFFISGGNTTVVAITETVTALSHALVPPLDHKTKQLKDMYFLIYRTDPSC